MRAARFAPLGFLPFVVIVLAVLQDRLPDPLAVHWSGAGHANGHQSQVGFGALMAGLWLLVWSLFLLVRRRYQLGRWGEAASPRSQLIGGYAALGLLLAVFLAIVSVNLDAESWQEPELDWRGVATIAGGAGLGAVLGWGLSKRLLDA